MCEAENRRIEPIDALAFDVVQHPTADQRLRQTTDGCAQKRRPFGNFAVAAQPGAWPKRPQYGDAALQVLFVVLAGWGWAKWLRGRRSDGSPLVVTRLGGRGQLTAIAAWALLWPATGFFLLRFTDTDVPWWDAFPTAGSLVGQYLLARKYCENWLAWLGVNVIGAGLYAYKGLWITALLYALFAALSVAGWRAWQKQLATASGAA